MTRSSGDGDRAEETLEPGRVGLARLRRLRDGTCAVRLGDESWAAIRESAAAVDRILASDRTVYGVNTGFGLLADARIGEDHLVELQRNLVLSHACGIGAALPDPVVRLVLALKIVSLARGASGVRPVVVERLLALLAADALPVIPAQGSVGASGDLAPLAHMTLALVGEGEIRFRGTVRPARAVLAELGFDPLVLAPKEGLALLNGTQVSTALALDALMRVEDVFAAALVAGALSTDALKGSDAPFDPRIHALRGHPGQIAVAARLKALLDGSRIRASHADCSKVQDPYSLRCQPQVMGAVLDQLRHVARVLETEANAVTDNPLIFSDGSRDGADIVLSGGNFHAEPVAFAADLLAMVAAEIASLSERRLALLVDPKMSGLPAFLTREPGLNSGFMIAQVTAAALVSENKTLAHPASVDSIPTSAGQEDHVSMATWAADKAGRVARNAARVVAIELLAAAQGVDLRAPLKTSPLLAGHLARIRERVPTLARDRLFAPDIAAVAALVEEGAFRAAAEDLLSVDG